MDSACARFRKRSSGIAFALLLLACGRSPLLPGEQELGASGGPTIACTTDLDCGPADACQAPACILGSCTSSAAVCDDGNVCTEDSCDSEQGCQHRALVADADGDGYLAPRPGFMPGAPDACGDDCDDRRALAHPGGIESCDAVDNDCDGAVDEGSVHRPAASAPVRISSPEYERAMRGGIAAKSQGFALTYTGYRSLRYRSLLKGVSRSGAPEFETEVSSVNADTFAGPVVWSGSALATAWEDAREDRNYEVHFRLFDESGQKLGPDARLTDAPGFSLHPAIVWNGSEYLVAWDDRRAERQVDGDLSRVYAQRLLPDGGRVGANVLLTGGDRLAESPDLSFSVGRIGFVATSYLDTPRFVFRAFDAELRPVGEPSDMLGQNVQAPTVHALQDRFVVLWEIYDRGPGDALWGAVFGRDGNLLVSPRPVSSGARFARTHAAVSLGDRLLVAWADDLDGNYEIYFQELAPDLSSLAPRRRVTVDPADTLAPVLSLGVGGTIGLLFDDWRDGTRQVYFTTLECSNFSLR